MPISKTQSAAPKPHGLKEWLDAKPYWEQCLWATHLENGTCTEEQLKSLLAQLLEQHGASPATAKPKAVKFPSITLDDGHAGSGTISISAIQQITNINAIDGACELKLAPGLNVIYGDNGAGKSGIGRLFSNACFSRSPRKMLTNARSKSTAKQSAKFMLTTAGGDEEHLYQVGKVIPALKTFSVFDREAAHSHLNKDNKIEFVPQKIQVFDEVFRSVSALETMLSELRSSKHQENPIDGVFQVESGITAILDEISSQTDLTKLQEKLMFTAEDKKLLATKRKVHALLQKQDTSKQKAKLVEECADLDRLRKELDKRSKVLTGVRAGRLNKLLKSIREKVETAKGLSAKQFNVAHFKHIGSAEWKALIQAAHKLYQAEVKSAGGKELNFCLLCNQSLSSEEKSLFAAYWKFLTSTVEQEIAAERATLKGYIQTLENEGSSWPAFSAGESATKILASDAPAELVSLRAAFKQMKADHTAWIQNLKKELDVTFTESVVDLKPVDDLIAAKQKQAKELVDPTKQIEKVQGEILLLEHKSQASALLPRIQNYVKWLKWDAAVRGINLSAVRAGITRKKTELMSQLVLSRYVDIFNEECERLECDFGLSIESHGRDASTIKGLKLDFAKTQPPSDILSEGEQTVSALADFLTEARIDTRNSGIIFDDPVTSLDHGRRSVIAQRLATEAANKQVIILTHDIAFLLELEYCAQESGISCSLISLHKIGDKVGVVGPDLPWIALDVKKRHGILKNRLPQLKKLETGDPDQYREAVKTWYGLLREAWERCIEERLFKSVVQRFNKAVQTLRLPKVVVTQELIKEVTKGMTEASKWVHDMAAAQNTPAPKNDRLIKDLQALEDFLGKCNKD